MMYEVFGTEKFFQKVKTEANAREMFWRAKFNGSKFSCPHCGHKKCGLLRSRPEVRKCSACQKHVRLRAGTILEHSKISLLLWVKAIYFIMQGKRGISVLELQKRLRMSSYGTTWSIMHKIREALRQRDDCYKLKGTVEFDGSAIGKLRKKNQAPLLVAVETKTWIDEKGRPKSKAGFAKIAVAPETKIDAQRFVNKAIEKGSFVNTDASPSLRSVTGVNADYRVMDHNKEALESWLPWVHRVTQNLRAWINGTHHGIEAKYAQPYIAEFLYRFNRRHDPEGLFHRALTACALAKPKTYGALFG
jgi:transposase-like protein